MTEKRFVYVIDNGEDTFYDLSEKGVIMDMVDTEEMLNNLHNENEELQKKLIYLIENGLQELFGEKYRIIEDIGDVE